MFFKMNNNYKFFNIRVRGALNSVYDPSYNTGTIVSFFLGNYFNCLDQVKVQLIVPVIFMVLMFFLPETPDYLIKRSKEKVIICNKLSSFQYVHSNCSNFRRRNNLDISIKVA